MIADTCLLIDLLRGDAEAKQHVAALEGEGTIVWIPALALYELWEGVERADRPDEESRRVQDVLERYTLLPLGPDHARRAGRLSGQLIRRGQTIDDVDALIAGTALEEGLPVLTRNHKHFDRVPGLEVVPY
jgi:tRNA(fMet)-specific endonuclease VapC